MLILFLISVAVISLCMLGMAIGLIVKGKSFTSCGNAALDFNGERIDCPACEMQEACKRKKADADAA